jgi:hypothetical protein
MSIKGFQISHPVDTLDKEIFYHDISEYIPCDTGGDVTHVRFFTRYYKGSGPEKQGKGYYSSFVPVCVEKRGDEYISSNIPVHEENNNYNLCFLGDKGKIFSKKNLQTYHEKMRRCSHFTKVMEEIKAKYTGVVFPPWDRSVGLGLIIED